MTQITVGDYWPEQTRTSTTNAEYDRVAEILNAGQVISMPVTDAQERKRNVSRLTQALNKRGFRITSRTENGTLYIRSL